MRWLSRPREEQEQEAEWENDGELKFICMYNEAPWMQKDKCVNIDIEAFLRLNCTLGNHWKGSRISSIWRPQTPSDGNTFTFSRAKLKPREENPPPGPTRRCLWLCRRRTERMSIALPVGMHCTRIEEMLILQNTTSHACREGNGWL